jgi:GT2 family glycosyltransferase
MSLISANKILVYCNDMDSSPPASPDVTVSIVSFNTRGLLRKCLASLQERQREGEITLEVIVVDNGSTDGSIMMVANEFPWVQTLQSDDNIGYGSANNLALAEAKGQFFLVLNSDTEVEPNALALMRDYLTAHEETGMVVPRLILPDGSTQASCARDPDLISVFWEQTYLNKIFPRNKVTGRYFMTHWDYNDTREV